MIYIHREVSTLDAPGLQRDGDWDTQMPCSAGGCQLMTFGLNPASTLYLGYFTSWREAQPRLRGVIAVARDQNLAN